jgi:cyclic pyranopterin phosphate synthase
MTAGATIRADGIDDADYDPAGHEPLIDRFGRCLTYLRVSVTERCHLRCRYCASAGENGTDAGTLQPAQFDRLLAVFRGLGARHVRFTGGEPLLSAGLNGRIAQARALGFARVSLTTNGHLLARKAAGLAAAGLHDVNVSLDSLDPARFTRITGGGNLRRVLAGLDAARRVLARVKLNVVLLRDHNLSEWPDLVSFAITHGYDIRFIEAMPLGAAGAAAVARSHVDTTAVHGELAQRYQLRPLTPAPDSGPARRFTVVGSAIEIGFISPLSQEFCASCNRLRLTARGRLVYCLGHTEGLDLRAALAQGLDDESLTALIHRRVARDKPKGHVFGPGTHMVPVRMMAIGG